MTAYYNEIDPYAAQWLCNLILEGQIAPGHVDTRSIEDVTANDLKGYTQCHFFAGIGVWSRALRLAGWPDDRAVWTGSCPCQPFSAAGKGAGFADERHLWPSFLHLIGECRPPVIFGEQVSSPDGLAWLDLVQADLEGTDYACGAQDICAAGIGAPHIRQRLYWVADHDSKRLSIGSEPDSDSERSEQQAPRRVDSGGRGQDGGLGHYYYEGLEGRRMSTSGCPGERTAWSPSDFVWCRDGKWRPVEPGTFPLVDVSPSRVGRLRAYGNAIVAVQAKEFIQAYLDL